jgi:excisionase family DNA binding protein
MKTVPEAARQLGRNPETLRRWIREGKLPAQKVGTQHFIAEEDLRALGESQRLSLPKEWQETLTGEPMPDWVQLLHRSRASH